MNDRTILLIQFQIKLKLPQNHNFVWCTCNETERYKTKTGNNEIKEVFAVTITFSHGGFIEKRLPGHRESLQMHFFHWSW